MNRSNPTPSVLFVKDGGPPVVNRRLVLRNISNKVVVIKLVVPHQQLGVITFSHDRLRLSPKSSLPVEMSINKSLIKPAMKNTYHVSGFVSCVESYNNEDVGKWLNVSGEEKQHQLAFTLHLRVCNDQFSAFETIVDIPGMASLVEGVPFATAGVDISDTVTGRAIDSDVLTARNFASQENILRQKPAVKAAKAKEESCWLVSMVSDYMKAPAAPSKSMKSKKSGKSHKKSRSGADASSRSKKSEKSDRSKNSRPSNQRKMRRMKTLVTETDGNKRKEMFTSQSEYVNSDLNATPCGGY